MTEQQAPALRVGHTERNAAVEALDQHLAAGRIDAEEYGERSARAHMARVRSDLDVLFLDLPAPHPGTAAPEAPRRAPAAARPPRRLQVPVVALAVGVWLSVCLVAGLVGHEWSGFFTFWIMFMLIGRVTRFAHHGHPRDRRRR